MPNFEDILNRNVDDIKPPPVLPEGTYLCVVQGLPEQIESSKKKTPGLRFKLQVVQAAEDVDPDEIAEIEGGVLGKSLNHDLWVTDAALNMTKEFCEHCGVLKAGATLSSCIDNTPNCSVMVLIKHDYDEDNPERKFAKVKKTMPYK